MLKNISKKKLIIFGLLLIFISLIVTVIYVLCDKSNKENFAADSNNEALSNIISIYNKNKMTLTDLDVTGVTNLVPIGTVISWIPPDPAKYKENIPLGWKLCDGQDGTPDLRGRFLRMYHDQNTKTYKSILGGVEFGSEDEFNIKKKSRTRKIKRL
jgi:hypothetical protein